MTRMHTFKQQQWEALNRSTGKFSASSAFAKLSSDLGKNSERSLSIDEEEEEDDDTSLHECKHLKVDENLCKRCGTTVPFFGSVCDTKSIKTFIKVVYIDESKKQQDQDGLASPSKSVKPPQQLTEIEIQD